MSTIADVLKTTVGMHKDLGLAIQTAHELRGPLPIGSAVRERYTEVQGRGLGGHRERGDNPWHSNSASA